MNFRIAVNYIVISTCCLLLIVATLFLVLQWGNISAVSAFGPEKQVNTALLIIFSGLGGCVLTIVVYWLIRNLLALRAGKRVEQAKESQQQTARRLEELELKANQSDEQPTEP